MKTFLNEVGSDIRMSLVNISSGILSWAMIIGLVVLWQGGILVDYVDRTNSQFHELTIGLESALMTPPKVETTAKERLSDFLEPRPILFKPAAAHISDVPGRFYAFCQAKADGSRPRELAGLIKAIIAKDVLTIVAMLSDLRAPCLDTRFFGLPPIIATVVDQFESFYALGDCKIVVKIRGHSGALAYSWVPCVGPQV